MNEWKQYILNDIKINLSKIKVKFCFAITNSIRANKKKKECILMRLHLRGLNFN